NAAPPMEACNFFLDRNRHLRSGWRVAIFAVAFIICVQVSHVILLYLLSAILHRSIFDLSNSNWSVVAGHGSILFSAFILGWACGALLEELPFRALGCAPHRGWLRNFVLGSILGGASLLLAAGISAVTRGTQFRFDPAGAGSIARTLILSLAIFVFAAAAEEILFRGYPLQTLTRANLAWLGILLTSVPFAAVHLNNPHAVAGFTFVNASLLGLPVSGIERIAPAPLLKGLNLGPDWLTGGAYGIEGGAACTIALIVSTLVIWRVKLFARADVT